jgi:hypothetical protein
MPMINWLCFAACSSKTGFLAGDLAVHTNQLYQGHFMSLRQSLVVEYHLRAGNLENIYVLYWMEYATDFLNSLKEVDKFKLGLVEWSSLTCRILTKVWKLLCNVVLLVWELRLLRINYCVRAGGIRLHFTYQFVKVFVDQPAFHRTHCALFFFLFFNNNDDNN